MHRSSGARPRRACLVLGCFLLLAGAVRLGAQETPRPDPAPGRRITLTEALARVDSASLELRLAIADVEAARARLVTAGTRPNPILSVEREQLGGDGSYHETIVAVGQSLDLSGQRSAQRAVAARDLAAAEARLAAERFRLGGDLRRAYLRAAALEARLGTIAQTVEIFRTVEQAGVRRFREGDISEYELQRLQVEAARFETLLAETRLDLTEAARELARLAGPTSSTPADELLFPADTLGPLSTTAAELSLDSALALSPRRPDLRAAEAEVEAAGALVDLRRSEARPNPTITGGLKEQTGGMYGAVLGVSIPLPVSDRNRGPIAEAQAAVAQAEARLALARRNADVEVRTAWDRRRSLGERLALRAGLLTRTERLLRAARVAYAEGEMTLIELLDAAESYRQAREAATTLLADYLQSAAELERATGGFDR